MATFAQKEVNNMLKSILAIVVFLISTAAFAEAATINAKSCSQADVQSAMNSASAGDTIMVPVGSCTWSGMTINKAVHLKGAGIGQTNIAVSENTITKQQAGVVRVSGFSFTRNGGGNERKGFTIGGAWQGTEPVIFENNDFTVSGSGLFHLSVAGGVIIAKNSFTGGWDDSFIQPKDDQDSSNSWGAADTIGAKDINGKLNLYIESNTFYGGTNQGIDCDDSSRCVYRYNTLTYSSFNTHGKATSPQGVRHFEVYNNKFIHSGGTSQIANQNWAIWIRGGTGVIYNNQIDNLAGSYWGDKPEVKLTIRGAEDTRPQGSCANVKYPVPRQLGQNYDGNKYYTDPIHIWGNTGTVAISAGWNWGNPCNLNFGDFFQWGRDAVKSEKPGYMPYTYPHPLLTGTVQQSCNEKNGVCCQAGQTCSGTTKTANDCDTCCIGTCQVQQQCIPGDVNCDGKVNIFDLVLVAQNYGKKDYTGPADLNGDRAVTILDLVIVAQNYGKTNTGDTTPPVRTNGQPSGNLPAGTISTTMSLSTDEAATCKYSTTAGITYSSMTSSFTATGTTTHSKSITGLANSNTYTYYVRCKDNAGNANTDDYTITFSVESGSSGGGGSGDLPEGNNGIAASYPDDANIQSDPNVIFADGFESYTSASQLMTKWDNYYQTGNARIATESGNVYSGIKSLEFTLPQTGSEIANEVSKRLSPAEDTLFIRVYTKFETGFSVVGQGHNGIGIKANYPGPGNVPNGKDFFLVVLENSIYLDEADPGYTNLYVYHPEQRSQWGDHWYADGIVLPYSSNPGDFGQNFVSRQNFIPQTNRWYSYEIMVKANTPGQRDGRVAAWIDGNLIADFQNIRLRDVSTLKMDEFGLNLHCQSSSRSNKKWYDNLVVARSYIGPMKQ
ncbi:MAG: dockerin type I domain-containing protein [Candidatus Woesearchaeota archaeon]